MQIGPPRRAAGRNTTDLRPTASLSTYLIPNERRNYTYGTSEELRNLAPVYLHRKDVIWLKFLSH